jgi:hypothetical protein
LAARSLELSEQAEMMAKSLEDPEVMQIKYSLLPGHARQRYRRSRSPARARPSTAANFAASHTDKFDTIRFITAWCSSSSV